MVWGCASARNLWGKSLINMAYGQKSICHSGRLKTKSLTKILTENALEYIAFGKDFIMDRLRLEI